jgi:hypothetical protein
MLHLGGEQEGDATGNVNRSSEKLASTLYLCTSFGKILLFIESVGNLAQSLQEVVQQRHCNTQ